MLFLKKQIEASKLKMDRKMSLILFSCVSFHIFVEPSDFFFFQDLEIVCIGSHFPVY